MDRGGGRVTVATIGVVVAGLAGALLLGAARGFDVTAVAILVLIAATGALAIAVARRSGAGGVQPLVCPACSATNARSAPYCKHCGQTL